MQHETNHASALVLHNHLLVQYKDVKLNLNHRKNQFSRTILSIRIQQFNVQWQLNINQKVKYRKTARKLSRIKRLKLLRTSRSFVRAKGVSRQWNREKESAPHDLRKAPSFLQILLVISNLARESIWERRSSTFLRLKRERNLTMITLSLRKWTCWSSYLRTQGVRLIWQRKWERKSLVISSNK